jgi:cellobiose phosphorylase
MAACLADMPDLAFDMYKKTCISERSRDVELYASEPYAYSENYVGPPHRLAGRAQYQWCLGEGANWMWHSYVYYILGVRPTLNGLLVDPKIPREWEGFKVTRPFRGATYQIEVSNPQKAAMGGKSMVIDGKEIMGNVIPAYADGETHLVKVALGS